MAAARYRTAHRDPPHRKLRDAPDGLGKRLVFSHPQARYFGLGPINEDQVHDYARRKGMDLKAIERWLGPSLGYEPNE